MKSFDVLVVGSGSGDSIVDAALSSGNETAYVERDVLGGTCLNRGCIPSKMVVYPADIITQIRHAERLGVKARIEEIDFAYIMERTRSSVAGSRRHMEEGINEIPGLTYYNETGEFISDYTLRVGDETIKARNIFLVTGARPLIPPIKGIEAVDYITSRTVWDLTEKPDSMIIVGGGLVAVEMAHFFSSVGVDVTILSRSPRLIKQGEPEVSAALEKALSERMEVFTSYEVTEASEKGGLKEVVARGPNGGSHTFRAETLLLAVGRRSNADLLNPEKTGVELDERGYIKVDENYETTKERIWAFGDAIGRAMYKHVANKEAEVVWHGFTQGHTHPLDYDKIPYAVYSWPQVASVGLTEGQALQRGLNILVGSYRYADTAKGMAMAEEDGFVKVVVEDESYRILGTHIIGPYAPILIQEVINVMHAGDGSAYPIFETMHIHPALPEVVQRAFYNLHKPGQHRH